ncbi:MAG: GNAT family N-acetyltransferase [Myxococcales bacterium]|jgi:CelD/BcsL family acetyltransferase involved in cellulose biosynthesis|nr:GNAT family N-acetyltransferase [Myxococcales bacterium]
MRRHVQRGTAQAEVEIGDVSAFLRLRERWDELVCQNPLDAPFLRHDFLRLWLENFAPDARLSLWTVGQDRRLDLALPLIERRGLFRGVPARVWRAPVNVHSCRFDLIAPPPDRVSSVSIDALVEAIADRAGDFDVIELPDVPEDGLLRQVWQRLGERGLPTFAWASMDTPWFDLRSDEEELGRTAHFRSNLRRRRKKLEALAPLSLQRCVGGSELEALLEEGFQIESAGWKGSARTAIACSPSLRAFYSEWARSNALSGELCLYFLRLGTRAIAFHFGIASGQTYYLPKCGFDESLAECSPGQILMDFVARDLIQRGFERFDFLGPSMSWKLDWAETSRAHHWLYVFADTRRGRLLHWLKTRDFKGLKGFQGLGALFRGRGAAPRD